MFYEKSAAIEQSGEGIGMKNSEGNNNSGLSPYPTTKYP
jgi:hypothetical protein